MREMSVTEQRYKAVLAVIGDGRTVGEVARDWGISRRTMHRWLARYESDGLEGLTNRSPRPAQKPHQMPPRVEAMVLEMRRSHPYWGARRIAYELAGKRVERAASESAVYRCLVRAAVIDPVSRQRRRESWKRWGRCADGALAAGPSAWLCLGRRGLSQGADRQRKGLHWALCPAAGRGALRPHLSRERGRSPAHGAALPDHHREDRALSQDPPSRVRHQAGVPQPEDSTGGAG